MPEPMCSTAFQPAAEASSTPPPGLQVACNIQTLRLGLVEHGQQDLAVGGDDLMNGEPISFCRRTNGTAAAADGKPTSRSPVACSTSGASTKPAELSWLSWLADIPRTVVPQAVVDTGARNGLMNSRRQHQRLAQLHNNRFLPGGQSRGQLARTVRANFDLVALLPLAHRGDADFVALGTRAATHRWP
ncbi:MAG TPA: hypothetical protein VGT81_14570 [Casimicrobiaceae bacterium]|nr:hypothetical protein [Casimicrobiaceae bacterium]